MTYLENADYFVRIVDLPPQVGGMVTPNNDGTYSLYLNSKKSHDQNIESYFHEVDHIENDDFYREDPIEDIEHV